MKIKNGKSVRFEYGDTKGTKFFNQSGSNNTNNINISSNNNGNSNKSVSIRCIDSSLSNTAILISKSPATLQTASP